MVVMVVEDEPRYPFSGHGQRGTKFPPDSVYFQLIVLYLSTETLLIASPSNCNGTLYAPWRR